MRVDEHTIRVLEFPAVLATMSGEALTPPGKAWISSLRPVARLADAEIRRDAIRQCMAREQEQTAVCIEPFEDVSGILERIRPDGVVLDGRELRLLVPILQSSAALVHYLAETRELNALRALVGTVQDIPDLRRDLARAILPEGSLADSASRELGRIRREIATTEARIERRLEALLRSPQVISHLQDTYVTRRGDRCVIPVKRSEQGRIKGVLHDVSQSGETAFIEPLETLPLGNELMRLQAEERAETRRILAALSSRVRNARADLAENFRSLTILDGLTALARFTLRERWLPCPFRTDETFHLREARHPLLEIRLRDEGRLKDLVPLGLDLDGNSRGLVISGSNTGGKTVILKTLGIAVLLAGTGLPIPAGEGTELPWTEFMGAVIGDEQSIADDLSTFSARMNRVVRMIRDAEPAGLVLLDELGSGTDPSEGAALSCAILDELIQRRTRVIASTHLDAVKAFAHTSGTLLNAAVSFDPRTLQPTYRLHLGQPGSSHAIEIAKRVGLPQRVIARARETLGPGQGALERLVKDLNETLRETETARRGVEIALRSSEEKEALFAERLEAQERARDRKMLEAVKEAETIVRETRKIMTEELAAFRAAIRTVKQPQGGAKGSAEAATLKETRAAVEGVASDLARKRKEWEEDDGQVPLVPESIIPGIRVHVPRLGTEAVVESFDPRRGRGRVVTGTLGVEVTTDDLFPARDRSVPESGRPGGDVSLEMDRSIALKPELLLVGQRVDPALSRLERFLNDAHLGGLACVRIVHGRGTGVLARAVAEFLGNHPAVSSFRRAEAAEGGEAVTIAELLPG